MKFARCHVKSLAGTRLRLSIKLTIASVASLYSELSVSTATVFGNVTGIVTEAAWICKIAVDFIVSEAYTSLMVSSKAQFRKDTVVLGLILLAH